MKSFLLECIKFYQKRISILKGPSCLFYPTCSEYAREAINKYGALKGCYLSFLRILRCHPWAKDPIDRVK